MKKYRGTILMVIGCICVAAAVAITVCNRLDAIRAARAAEALLADVKDQLPESGSGANLPKSGDMPAIDVEGRSFIGIVTIPAINITLPVQRDWSKLNARVSPCRYKGSVYDNDLIIAGHNYPKHFGKLKDLMSGDEVIVTDVNGYSYYYEVTNTETIDTYDVDAMDRGDWDLTVFTCTIGGKSRVTVRCDFTGKIEDSRHNVIQQ